MELDKVIIKNFRSIPEVTIDFDQRCKILVGINEAGKSNILKALSLLSEEIKIDPSDIREPPPEEDPIKESKVLFVFKLSEEDLSKIMSELSESFLLGKNNAIVNKKGRDLKLIDFMRQRNEVLYRVDLENKEKIETSWNSEIKEVKICNGWKKVKNDVNATVETVFSMIKVRLGEYLKCRNIVAQRNELAMKFLCHNVCCLIQEMFERNVKVDFRKCSKEFVEEEIEDDYSKTAVRNY